MEWDSAHDLLEFYKVHFGPSLQPISVLPDGDPALKPTPPTLRSSADLMRVHSCSRSLAKMLNRIQLSNNIFLLVSCNQDHLVVSTFIIFPVRMDASLEVSIVLQAGGRCGKIRTFYYLTSFIKNMEKQLTKVRDLCVALVNRTYTL